MARSRLVGVLLKPTTWVIPYLAIWLAAALLPIQPTDADVFFWPSAKVAVLGHPLLVYTANGHATYPNANGPLALVPLTAVGLVLRAVGWLDDMTQRRAVALTLFSVFILLMAREAMGSIERMRGRPLPRVARISTYVVLTLAPPVWQSVLGYGHIEQPIEIWLLLIAARLVDSERPAPAGAALALAVLSRSSAFLMSVPLGLGAWQRRRSGAVKLFATAAATGAAGIVPFVLADPADVIHSLFTYRSHLVVGAGSIWSLTHSTAYEPIAQHWDFAVMAAAVLAVNLVLGTRPGGLDRQRLYAAMALTAACFAMLAKTVWAYYVFEAYVFAVVWAVGSWRSRDSVVRLLLLPSVLCVVGMVAEIGSAPDLPAKLVSVEGAGMFAVLLLTGLWTLWAAGSHPRPELGIPARRVRFQSHGTERAD